MTSSPTHTAHLLKSTILVHKRSSMAATEHFERQRDMIDNSSAAKTAYMSIYRVQSVIKLD